MKILLLNPEYPPVGGGAGTASMYLAEHLVRMGHEVTLITARYRELPHAEQRNGVSILRCPAGRRDPARSAAAEQILYIFSSFATAASRIRTWRPDITLAFFGIPSGVTAFLLKRLWGIPYIVSMRGGDVPGARPGALYIKLAAPFLHLVWRHADALIANSRGLKELAQAFEPDLPIEVIPNGVDTAAFSPAPEMPETAQILFVGRLAKIKGPDVLLRALAQLKACDWHCTLVGDGPQRPELEALARSAGLTERLTFAGWQPRDALLSWYQRASVFVLPSRQEGMPNALLEAMACGLPAVATRVSGSAELVLEGETGFLVPPEDDTALAQALKELILSPSLRAAMGARARKRAEREYSWERAAGLYAEIMMKHVEAKPDQ